MQNNICGFPDKTDKNLQNYFCTEVLIVVVDIVDTPNSEQFFSEYSLVCLENYFTKSVNLFIAINFILNTKILLSKPC